MAAGGEDRGTDGRTDERTDGKRQTDPDETENDYENRCSARWGEKVTLGRS